MTTLAIGDVVVIPAVDRLSRNAIDPLMIARDIQRAAAGLRSIAEPVVDTTSAFAELVLAMLAVSTKLERRRIIERTARGRAAAMAKGVQFGRKPKLPPRYEKRGNGLPAARHSVASPAATTSARRRFRD